MSLEKCKIAVENILSAADVKVNGDRPWDIQVGNERFFERVLNQGSLGLGESFMDGWWDAKRLDEFFYRLFKVNIEDKAALDWKTKLWIAGQAIFNTQRKSKATEIGERHYDIGNDLYEAMLDKRKVYTCGYWKNAKDLDEAQEAKLELVCKKLGLKPGQKVLDIGCGWGSFAKYAAEKHGAIVTGVTVSKEQIAWGNELCADLPVDLHFKDYREIEGQYDHIVSLGMFEHVGSKNYRTFMKIAHKHLKDDGLFLLHTIGNNRSAKTPDPWVGKYIFPNSMLPSIKQIGASIEKLFIVEDWHNFGVDYDETLMAWFANFDRNWVKLQSRYSDRFYRMWKYYLMAFAGSFRARKYQLWQIVLSKDGVPGGYEPARWNG